MNRAKEIGEFYFDRAIEICKEMGICFFYEKSMLFVSNWIHDYLKLCDNVMFSKLNNCWYLANILIVPFDQEEELFEVVEVISC